MFGSIWEFIKPYLAKTLTSVIFTAIGGILVKIGIDSGTLYQIILGILGIIGGGVAVAKAHNTTPPPSLGAVIAKRVNGGS